MLIKQMSSPIKRILKELKYFEEEEPDGVFRAGPENENNLFRWIASFHGPIGSPYEGGIFTIGIHFPIEYPFKAPKVNFITKIYHPNIKLHTGENSLDILYDKWNPSIKVIDILKYIQNLLVNPDIKLFIEKDITKQYLENREDFNKTAKKYTEKYAI